jgi:uncharacterized protein
VLNLLVATDGAVETFGYDVRRLRPNLLISNVAADVENTWPGHALKIGDVLIGVHSIRGRCVIPTIDPDTAEQDLDVGRKLRRDFGNQLALNCWVITPGIIHRNDAVELVDTNTQPQHYGGWIVGAPYNVRDDHDA